MAEPIWQRWALPGLDSEDWPHPMHDGLERRFWRPWHYAILIYTEMPRDQWRAQCSLARQPNDVARALASIERLGVDRVVAKARIAEWEHDKAAQQHHVKRIKLRNRAGKI